MWYLGNYARNPLKWGGLEMPLRIVIHCPNHDWTPTGKRQAKVVKTTRGTQLRFYVAGRTYRWLAPTPENLAMARLWLDAEGAL